MMAAKRQETMDLAGVLGERGREELAGFPVGGISADSRSIEPGDVFFACAGASSHGLDYLDQALQSGAVAVVWDPSTRGARELPSSVLSVPVADLNNRIGSIADRFYDSPSQQLKVLGVTGTNGKTTCAHLVATALQAAGYSAGQMGTLGFGFPGRLERSALTTSDCIGVHAQLASLRDAGASYVAMEVSSHALVQGRVDQVSFDLGLFTNLSRDHLDYHPSMDDYGAAKARLFDTHHPRKAIINVDDDFGRHLYAHLSDQNSAVAVSAAGQDGFTGAGGLMRGLGFATTRDGLCVSYTGTWGSGELNSPLVGSFNVENLLLALSALLCWQFPVDVALDALARCPAPPGRMEAFRSVSSKPLVLVDYAHTPAALKKALKTARAHCSAKLWCVFGCGGDRDAGKRPLMGAVAAELADRIVVTDDNPRGEDPDSIIEQIMHGMPDPERALIIRDRGEAIGSSIRQARPDDLVLVAGKGHEDYQIVGDEIRRFSDRAVVREALGSDT